MPATTTYAVVSVTSVPLSIDLVEACGVLEVSDGNANPTRYPRPHVIFREHLFPQSFGIVGRVVKRTPASFLRGEWFFRLPVLSGLPARTPLL